MAIIAIEAVVPILPLFRFLALDAVPEEHAWGVRWLAFLIQQSADSRADRRVAPELC